MNWEVRWVNRAVGWVNWESHLPLHVVLESIHLPLGDGVSNGL